MIEWEDRDIVLIKKIRGEVNWASGILMIFLISEDIEPWYSYRQYSYKKNGVFQIEEVKDKNIKLQIQNLM